MSRILLIEDNEKNARLEAKILQRHGHTVFIAQDGETGFTTAVEVLPEIILLDLGLPDVEGQTLASLFRQQPALAQTPIVAVTAWPEDTAKEMARAYGCDGFISKPIDIMTFNQDVLEFCAKKA